MTKVLVICDDIWHPADVIRRGLEDFDEDISFDFVITAKDILTPEMLAQYPVIFNCKANYVNAANSNPWFEEGVTEVGPAQFEEYIRKGGVFAAIHSGTCYSIKEGTEQDEKTKEPNDAMVALTGCSFDGHPPRCEVTAHVALPDHPVMKGVQDFTERDEHYQMIIHIAGVVPLLLTTSATGQPQIAAYERRIGEGRLIVLTPGHTLAVWKNPEFRKILRNIIRMGEK